MEQLRVDKSKTRGLGSCRQIIVAERDEPSRASLLENLHDLDCDMVSVRDHEGLVNAMEKCGDAVVVLGSRFDHRTNLGAMGQMRLDGFANRVVFLTDKESPQFTDRATRMGAQSVVQRSHDMCELKRDLNSLMKSKARRAACGSFSLIGDSSAMKDLREVIRNVADTDAAVMILGESGTGKELVARAIHDCSDRVENEFVPVNMAALPESLVESVLFGHERGAFTGADSRQTGLCHQAHKGTLFLDEIGEMNRELQPKLLRFLQEYTVQRIGSTKVEVVDARVVSATNRPVHELLQPGILREDLFFRLHVIPIQVPSLRERKDDIPLLANAFLKRKCAQARRELRFSDEVLERMCGFSWPGNIRQLENLVERMVVMTRGEVIEASALQLDTCPVTFNKPMPMSFNNHSSFDIDESVFVNDRKLTRMESSERSLIVDALDRHNGNVTAAARFLGLGPATIYRKIRTFEISKGNSRGEGQPASLSETH